MPKGRRASSRAGTGGGSEERKSGPGVRKFKDAAELQAKLDEYFDKCDEDGRLYSEQGMALHLGVSMALLGEWWRGRKSPDLQDTVQMAYLRIAEQIATDPRYNEKPMVSLKIFLLKQQKYGGYQDRIEARQDIAVNVKMGGNMDASDFE